MKTLPLIVAALFIMTSCNNAADNQADQPDTTSSLPAPATVDTSSLQTDSPKVEKALRK
jgi:hypothetical protein